MNTNLKLLLENLDQIDNQPLANTEQIINNDQQLLEQQILDEWQQFQKLVVEQGPPVIPPSQIPIGTTQQKPKPDPRAVTTLSQIKAATKNPRINVAGTANAMAKSAAGQPLSRKEQMDVAVFNQAVGGAAQQAILNPLTAKQTISAIKNSQQAQKAAQIRAAQAQKKR
jgi:hypothetical protein